MKSVLSLLPLRDRWPSLFLGLILLILTLGAGLVLLLFSGGFITASALAGLGLIGMINIFTPGAVIRAAALARTLARYAERLITHAATLELLTELRMRIFTRLVKRPELELEQLQRGDTASRLTADIDTLDHAYLAVFQPAAGALLLNISVIGLAALWSPILALAVLLPLLLANLLLVLICHRTGRRASRHQARAYPAFRQQVMDGLESRIELRAFGLTETFTDTIGFESRALIDRGRQLALLDALGGASILGVNLLAIVATLWLGLPLVEQQRLPGPLLAALVLGLFALSEAWLALPAAWRRLSQCEMAAERVRELLPPEHATDQSSDVLTTTSGLDLALENLTFRWARHQSPVLDQLQFRLAAGQRLAVLGASGCGKTTLLRLLMGQILPEQGRVLIGGVPIDRLCPKTLQRRTAYLPQTPVLFRDSVGGNLRIANEQASDKQLILALERAGLADWLDALPLGLNSWVDEAAGNLSGGERQRLAMARLFLTDPELVLLDEPTASLDRVTLEIIRVALDEWLTGRTTVLVTHRLDGLPPIDQVLKLD